MFFIGDGCGWGGGGGVRDTFKCPEWSTILQSGESLQVVTEKFQQNKIRNFYLLQCILVQIILNFVDFILVGPIFINRRKKIHQKLQCLQSQIKLLDFFCCIESS